MGSAKKTLIDNGFYDELGERWYSADDDPVALLRAEARLKNPWVLSKISTHFSDRRCRILDIGCGAGFLTNALAEASHEVVGIDLSEESLKVARHQSHSNNPFFEKMDAYDLRFPNESFDVVCAMDFLEHVNDPRRVIENASRVLKPGGLFFFHTFNRNRLSWLIVIKGVEWFVKNTPPNMHVYPLFIKPKELRADCEQIGLQNFRAFGIRPRIFCRPFAKLLRTGRVDPQFSFVFSSSTALGYLGHAAKSSSRVT